MLASLIREDLELLLNADSAFLDGSGTVVVDTIGASGSLAVVSAEGGGIGPIHGRRGKARTVWDLSIKNVTNPR
jgi:hypothetical protein